MKTPREILFRQHTSVRTKLDSVRKRILAAECGSETRDLRALPLRAVLKLWSELVLPAHRIWAGVAFVWVLIAAVNIAGSDHSQRAVAIAKPVSTGTLMALKEQQKILAELVGATEPREAEKPKLVAPQPRSQRREFWRIG